MTNQLRRRSPPPARRNALGRCPRQERASDAERERAVGVLSHAATIGRLDVDELDERLQAAWSARTRADIERLVVDVDVDDLAAAPPAPGVTVAEGAEGTRWVVSIMGGAQVHRGRRRKRELREAGRRGELDS